MTVKNKRAADLRRKNEEFSRRLERGERQISVWLDRDSQARLERLRERCGTNAAAIQSALWAVEFYEKKLRDLEEKLSRLQGELERVADKG